MSANDKHTHYAAGDIQRYLSGELSPREMHALEAAALEDPFLADALEGLEKDRSVRGATALRDDMTALQKKLESRIEKRDRSVVLPFYRSAWKVAAALLLLIGSGAIAYRYLTGGPKRISPLASAEKKAAPANAPAVALATADSVSMKINDSTEAVIPASTAKSKSPLKPAGAGAQAQAPAPAPDEADSASDSASMPFRGNKFEPDAVAEASYKKANKYLLAGKVVDNNNNRIPLVMISFQGHHQAVKTDSSGLFRVQMLGSDSASHIRISSTGYTPVELPVGFLARNTLTDTIRLMPTPSNDAFSDVVVMGYGTPKKKFEAENDKQAANNAMEKDAVTVNASLAKKAFDEQAAPVNGWPAFQSYLEKNKWNATTDSTLKGMEAISFQVNKKGRLSSFKVQSSLSPAHDSLLLRLIRHGPAWRPVAGKSGSTTVLLPYK